MIYLVLAVVSSAMVSIVMRLSEGRTRGQLSMLVFNYIMCLCMAGLYMGSIPSLSNTYDLGLSVGLGAFNGLLYLLGFILLQINVRKNGVVLSATFMKLGLLVPMAVSVGLFGEIPSIPQTIGFLLAVAAIILINFEKGQNATGFKLGLILMLLAGGGGDAMSKIFEEFGNPDLAEEFLFFTFACAGILCVALMVYRKERPGISDLIFGLLIGIPNYFSSRFLLKALGSLPAVIVYPTYSVATIVTVTMAGLLFFREKLGKRQLIAVGIILTALILLNI